MTTLSDIEFAIVGEIDDADDVMRCVKNLILTPAGTIPLARDFGIDQSILGKPLNVAQSELAVEIIDKVDKFEPRASVEEITLEANADGQIIVKVVLTNG